MENKLIGRSKEQEVLLKALYSHRLEMASQKNIVVVICGSSASWMIQKVVEHKGGLHNRLTRRVYLFAKDE